MLYNQLILMIMKSNLYNLHNRAFPFPWLQFQVRHIGLNARTVVASIKTFISPTFITW